MNLEKLNLIELNAQEVVSIEGGKGWGFNISIFGFSLISYDSERPSDSNWRTDFW